MIFPDSYDPYGELLGEEINEDILFEDTGDIKESISHEETTPDTTPELNKREHGSFLQENYSKIWIDNQNNKKITSLISFGIVAGVSILLLKRFLK